MRKRTAAGFSARSLGHRSSKPNSIASLEADHRPPFSTEDVMTYPVDSMNFGPRRNYRARLRTAALNVAPTSAQLHTPLPCEVRKGNDTTPRTCCPNSAAPGAVKPGMDDEPVVPRPCSWRQDKPQVGAASTAGLRDGWPRIRRSDVTEYLAGARGSLRLDACELNHLSPLLGFGRDEICELGRRTGEYRRP